MSLDFWRSGTSKKPVLDYLLPEKKETLFSVKPL